MCRDHLLPISSLRVQVHELHRLYRVQKQLMTSGGALSRPSSELISCRRRRQVRRGCLIRQPRRAMDLRLPTDDYILVVGAGNTTPPPPPQRQEDGLELTLAIGAGGRRKRRDDEDEGAGAGTPVGSDCCSGGSLTSSSTTSGGSPPYRRAVTQQQPPWLVQCLRLKMA